MYQAREGRNGKGMIKEIEGRKRERKEENEKEEKIFVPKFELERK